jgi:hypothetical protein
MNNTLNLNLHTVNEEQKISPYYVIMYAIVLNLWRCEMIKNLVFKNRSYRRFYQNEAIELTTLKELIDLARLSASVANL